MGYLFLNIRFEELKAGSFFIFLFKFKLGNFPSHGSDKHKFEFATAAEDALQSIAAV